MNTQNRQQPTLPTRISLPRVTQPVVRFGEGWIAPKVAMHHGKELNAQQKTRS